MNKAVLISIRPEWCEKIASGQKTIEVRKTRPKTEAPFKCYIYKTKCMCSVPQFVDEEGRIDFRGRGQVIGEFFCDRVYECDADSNGLFDKHTKERLIGSCLNWAQIFHYTNGYMPLFGWHISNLVIYDKPRELSEFYKSGFSSRITLTRPPMSWCYVEEL